MEMRKGKEELSGKGWFFFLSLYLLVEYCRVQTFIPIGALRPGLLLTLILSVYCVKNVKHGLHVNRQVLLILLFIMLLFLYIPLARNNYRAFKAATTLLLQLPFFFSVIILLTNRSRISSLMKVYVVIMSFLSVYCILHNGQGPGGIVRDENDLSLFLVTILPFAFFLLVTEKKKYQKVLLIGCIVLAVVALVATKSRGGFVGFLAMGMAYFWYGKRKVVILICVAIIGGGLLYFGSEQYLQEMSTITDTKESTASARLLSWNAGWQIFLDFPLGVGGNNFPVHFSDYSQDFPRDMWGRAAHSLWFTLLPETGLIGTFLYLLILCYNYGDLRYLGKYEPYNYNREVAEYYSLFSIALLSSFAGFFGSATFLSVLYYPEFWHLTAILVAVKKVTISDDEGSMNSTRLTG